MKEDAKKKKSQAVLGGDRAPKVAEEEVQLEEKEVNKEKVGNGGKEKTVTANYEVKSIESRNEPLCLNYSLRHMWIGFSFP